MQHSAWTKAAKIAAAGVACGGVALGGRVFGWLRHADGSRGSTSTVAARAPAAASQHIGSAPAGASSPGASAPSMPPPARDAEGLVFDRVELPEDSTMDDLEFTPCRRESMDSTVFEPPPAGSSEMTVVYPMELSPMSVASASRSRTVAPQPAAFAPFRAAFFL